MKNKKRIFAAFAAAAVAVSMFAFTGCGSTPDDGNDGDKTPAGVIEGNYKDKTDAEVTEILGNINTSELFGDMTAADAAMGIGVKVNMEGAFAMGEMMSASGSLNMDYKMYQDATYYTAGEGTVAVNAHTMSMMTGVKQENTIDISAKLYNGIEKSGTEDAAMFMYGSITGLGENAMTGKINMNELMASFGGSSDEYSLFDVADEDDSDVSIGGSVGMDIAGIIAMAKQFDISMQFDTTDGVKAKISVTEDTIWKVLAASEVDQETITMVQGLVTFNKFQFDVYFSIDKDGLFDRASIVTDIDIKVDGSVLGMLPQAEASGTISNDITVSLKGSVEVTTFSDKITVPTTVEAYDDMTKTVIEMIKSMMPGGPDEGEPDIGFEEVA